MGKVGSSRTTETFRPGEGLLGGGGAENCCRVPSDSHFSVVAGCRLDGWQGTGSRPEAQPVAAATALREGTVTVTVNFLCQLG